MSKRRRVDVERRVGAARPPSPFESGVLPKGLADESSCDRDPPWDVVLAYLTRGEHPYWVEGRAARSPAFRDVLDALRNDQHELEPSDHERGAMRRRNVVGLKRRR